MRRKYWSAEEDKRKARWAIKNAEESEGMLKVLNLVSGMADLFVGIKALTDPEDLDRNSALAVLGLCHLGGEAEKLFYRQFEEYRKQRAETMRQLMEENNHVTDN